MAAGALRFLFLLSRPFLLQLREGGALLSLPGHVDLLELERGVFDAVPWVAWPRGRATHVRSGAAQTPRTFCASSPLRPGAVSNSTR